MDKGDKQRDRKDVLGDKFDVIAKSLTTHDKSLKEILSDDFVLFEPKGMEEIDALTEYMTLSSQMKNYIYDEEEGKKVFELLMNEVKMYALLRRNTKNNFLLSAVLEQLEKALQEPMEAKDIPKEALKDELEKRK